MKTHGGRVEWLSHVLHSNLLWLLLGSYALAAAWPRPGLAAPGIAFGEVAIVQERVKVSLPLILLAALLVNAGLGSRVSQLRGLARAVGTAGGARRERAGADRVHLRAVDRDGRLAQPRRGAEHPGGARAGRRDAHRRVVDGLGAERRRRPRA